MQVEHINGNLPAGVSGPDFLRRSALLLGAALVASAMVCWVAANWAYADKFQKLAGAQVLLALIVLAAGWTAGKTASGNRNLTAFAQLLALACVCVGAMLALQGQIYQTGADAWQLFALWAVLLLPWLFGLHTVFLAVLSGGLLNIAAILAFDDGMLVALWSSGFGSAERALLLALVNGVMLLLAERYVHRLEDRWRIAPRLAALAMLGWLFWTLLLLHFDSGNDGLAWAVVLGGLLVCALMAAVYRDERRFDLAMLSQTGLFVLGVVVMQFIVYAQSEWVLVPLILTVAVLSGLILHWLRRLYREHRNAGGAAGGEPQRGPAPGAADEESEDPWYISHFRLGVMWLLTLLLLALMFLVLQLDIEDVWVWGLLLAGGCLGMRFLASAMLREAAAALASVGLVLVCWQWLELDARWTGVGTGALLALAAVGGIAYGIGRHALFRFFCAGMVTFLLLNLTWGTFGDWFFDSAWMREDVTATPYYLSAVYWRLWLLALGAVLCLSLSLRGGKWTALRPMAWALAILAQTMAWLAPSHWMAMEPWASPAAFNAQLLRIMFALLPAMLLGIFWKRQPDILPVRTGIGAIVVLVVAGFGWLGAPGIVLALVWLLLGAFAHGVSWRHAGREAGRPWIVLGAAGLLVYLCRFYFDLDISLLDKSGVLAAMGLWFLAGGWLLRESSEDGRTLPPRRTLGWLAAGLIAVLAVVNTDIYRKEALLADGRTVILELAPVDPRSLMQGDYMALDFQATADVRQILSQAEESPEAGGISRSGGYMLLRPDADGVHRVAAISASRDGHMRLEGDANRDESTDEPTEDTAGARDAAEPLGDASTEVAMRFRMGEYGRPEVGVNAFFFTEGDAVRFERAKYGEFRVSDSGGFLLVRLLDVRRRPL